MMHKTVSCHNCLCFGFLWRIWVRWCFTQVSKNGGKRMSLITFVLPAPPSESFVFGSHNWDSSSISGFLSTIQNENRKKQGPGVIIKYCCSMGIWWMIIVSTFLRLHQRILNSSINSFLTDSKSKCLYLVYNKQEKFRDWSSLPLNYKGM